MAGGQWDASWHSSEEEVRTPWMSSQEIWPRTAPAVTQSELRSEQAAI